VGLIRLFPGPDTTRRNDTVLQRICEIATTELKVNCRVSNVPMDGNCQFSAIALQINTQQSPDAALTASDVRLQIINFITSHRCMVSNNHSISNNESIVWCFMESFGGMSDQDS